MKFKYKETIDVVEVIKKAGKEILGVYKKDFKSYNKDDDSPVTEADLLSEKIILEGLRRYNYGILSEERVDDLSRIEKERVWIIDPLDGTKDFIQKTGQFSVMIALAEKGKPILGAVYQPTEDKLYLAEKGNGSFLLKDSSFEKLFVSSVDSVSEATFVFSRNHLFKKEKDFIKKNNIEKKIFMGSVGLKVGLVAEGKADCYITFSDKTCQWDTCAPEIILKEAGGSITDTKGKSFIYNRKEKRNLNGILASNGSIQF